MAVGVSRLALMATIALTGGIACGQATGNHALPNHRHRASASSLSYARLAAPIRPVSTMPESMIVIGDQTQLFTDQPPLPPHSILRAPTTKRPTPHHAAGTRHSSNHPPHLSLHRRVVPPPATLPSANRRETWKAPYSYGYFGASSKRHWTMHRGYRDRYTEWRLQ